MSKIIFWLVIVFAVMFVLRLINARNARARTGAAAPKKQPANEAGAMLRCVDCGVYLPSADATASSRGPLCGDPECVNRRRSP